MSNEETQKQIDFLVEHQARFAVNQEKADERLTRLENIVANSYVDMRDRYNALVGAQLKSEEKIAALAEAQHQAAEAQRRAAEAQANTDERLNTLINVVERHISDQSNGKRQ